MVALANTIRSESLRLTGRLAMFSFGSAPKLGRPGYRGRVNARTVRDRIRGLRELGDVADQLRNVLRQSVAANIEYEYEESVESNEPKIAVISRDRDAVVSLLREESEYRLAEDYDAVSAAILDAIQEIVFLSKEGARMMSALGKPIGEQPPLKTLQAGWLAKIGDISHQPGMTPEFAEPAKIAWEQLEKIVSDSWTPPDAYWSDSDDGERVFLIDWRRNGLTASCEVHGSGVVDWFAFDHGTNEVRSQTAPAGEAIQPQVASLLGRIIAARK